MADSYKDISGALVFTATLKAYPEKADQLARHLKNEKAQSDNEPGTLRYDAVRYVDQFAVWETFASQDAIEAHIANLDPDYKEFLAHSLAEPPAIFQYPADSLHPQSDELIKTKGRTNDQ